MNLLGRLRSIRMRCQAYCPQARSSLWIWLYLPVGLLVCYRKLVSVACCQTWAFKPHESWLFVMSLAHCFYHPRLLSLGPWIPTPDHLPAPFIPATSGFTTIPGPPLHLWTIHVVTAVVAFCPRYSQPNRSPSILILPRVQVSQHLYMRKWKYAACHHYCLVYNRSFKADINCCLSHIYGTDKNNDQRPQKLGDGPFSRSLFLTLSFSIDLRKEP